METILNQNGCDSVIININLTFENFQLAISFENPPCYGDESGQISIESIDGNAAYYEYAIDNASFEVIPRIPLIINSLAPGIYEITVRDPNGCSYSEKVTISQQQEVAVKLGPDQTIDLGDSIQIKAVTNLTNPIIFWEPAGEINCGDCLDPWVRPYATTDYFIEVYDSLGCYASDDIRIYVNRTEHLFIPNAFSPDGDGYNDKFIIFASPAEVRIIKEFQIFDRWGERVFYEKNFHPNDPAFGWDGNYRNKPATEEVYVYNIIVEFIDGTEKTYRGGITLIR